MPTKNKIGIVLGTRPEIIKLAPVIYELERRNAPYFVIHTGQHYSENMDTIFWNTLKLAKPKYQLFIRESTHARQTSEMLRQIDLILEMEKPDWALVQGDTNSTLAGALAASKHKDLKLAHLEAGLRSFDRQMPEEINRLIVDRISHLLLTPTSESTEFLLQEGVDPHSIAQVGNTVEDTLNTHIDQATQSSQILTTLNINPQSYILITIHRQENTESKERLLPILDALFDGAQSRNLSVIFPIHPRTRQRLHQWDYRTPTHVQLIDPVDYYDFLLLEKNARLVATDSGGVQEESCILHVPCITLRENTERPETVRLGANKLVGIQKHKIALGMEEQINKTTQGTMASWKTPYGGGLASERVVNLLLQ